jgi:hypothetical protein
MVALADLANTTPPTPEPSVDTELTDLERQLPRRRPARRGLSVTCRAGQTGLGPNLALELRDISEDGLGLVLSAPLPPGRDAEVELTGPFLPKPIRRRVEVVWCQPVSEGHFWAGLRLRSRLDYPELSNLTRQSFIGEAPAPTVPRPY